MRFPAARGHGLFHAPVRRVSFALERTRAVAITPTQARINALKRWSKEPNRSAATAAARLAAFNRFEKLVDPHGELPPSERAKRAESARKAFYLELAQKGLQARQKRTAK